MNASRPWANYRSTIVLAAISGACLVSLASGTQAGPVRGAAERLIAGTAYPFLAARRMAGGAVDGAVGLFFGQAALKADNAALHEDVMRLKIAVAERAELAAQNARLGGMLGFARREERLTLDAARVVQSAGGMVWIDRGRLHGIEPAMAVVAPAGIVGVVVQVDDFTSSVATLHHRDCRAGAMVMRNRLRAYDGILHPSGSDLSRICTMEFIDAQDEVRVGDLVVASPESLFPVGYPIGKVTGVGGSGTLWKSAEIEPAVDVYRLDEVFVVRRAMPEAEDLAGPPAAPASMAPEQPDPRSLQERYAP